MTAVVRFCAGGGSYAVPVSDVWEVRPATEVSPLPLGRPGVAGLATRGGQAFPVLSVLGADHRQLLLLHAGGRTFGLLVEEVSGIGELDEQRLAPPPEGQDGQLVTGVWDPGSSGAQLVLLLDAAALGRQALEP